MTTFIQNNNIQNNNIQKESYNTLYDSGIYDDTNKIKSNLGESFMIINEGKNLNELNKKDYNIIKHQNDYRNYQDSVKYIKQGSTVYGIVKTALTVGKFFIGLL